MPPLLHPAPHRTAPLHASLHLPASNAPLRLQRHNTHLRRSRYPTRQRLVQPLILYQSPYCAMNHRLDNQQEPTSPPLRPREHGLEPSHSPFSNTPLLPLREHCAQLG